MGVFRLKSAVLSPEFACPVARWSIKNFIAMKNTDATGPAPSLRWPKGRRIDSLLRYGYGGQARLTPPDFPLLLTT